MRGGVLECQIKLRKDYRDMEKLYSSAELMKIAKITLPIFKEYRKKGFIEPTGVKIGKNHTYRFNEVLKSILIKGLTDLCVKREVYKKFDLSKWQEPQETSTGGIVSIRLPKNFFTDKLKGWL